MTESEKPSVFVVLGMHRSGTSFLTKSLELLGIGLGEKMMKPADSNPKGFWEDQEVVDLNIEIMKTQESDFADLGFKPPSREEISNLHPLFEQAVALVSNRISSYSRWAFKDPRTCRTIAFWQAAIEAAGATPKFIIAVRNPLEVAASLKRRDAMPIEQGLYSWLQHTIPAFTETQGAPRVVVEYAQLLRDPHRELSRVSQALLLPLPAADSPEMQAFNTDFLDTTLRHHHCSVEDLTSDPTVPREVIEVYLAARRVALDEESIDGAAIVEKLSWANSRLRMMAPIFNVTHDLESRVQALLARAQRLEMELLESAATIHHLSDLHSQVSHAHRDTKEMLSSVLSSHSWKLTSPLRAATNMLRKLTNRSARDST
jgi:hypothetical protein